MTKIKKKKESCENEIELYVNVRLCFLSNENYIILFLF
jgi:hypothetical protein